MNRALKKSADQAGKLTESELAFIRKRSSPNDKGVVAAFEFAVSHVERRAQQSTPANGAPTEPDAAESP